MLIWNSVGLVLLSGFLSGSMVGVVEALTILLAVGAGEYDALLWGGIGYGVVGILLSVPFCVVGWRWEPQIVFGRVLTTCTFLITFWVFDLHWWWSILWFVFHWLQGVFLTKTPLRVVLTLKGALLLSLGWVGLLVTFSLTPGQRIFTPPVHQRQAIGKPNVLFVVVDGLSKELLQRPSMSNLRALSKNAIVFEQAVSISPSRFQSMSTLLVGSAEPLPTPLLDSEQTLVERLALEGYRTLGVVTHLEVGRFANIHQGFDRFRYIPPHLDSLALRFGLGSEGARHLKLAAVILGYVPLRRRSVEEVFSLFDHELRMFAQEDATPWFALLQLTPNVPFTDADQQAFDRQMGVLLRSATLDNTLIVLTAGVQFQQSDHPRLDIPLWMWIPNGSARMIVNNVQLADVAPTIFSILGYRADHTLQGQNILRLPPIGDRRVIDIRGKDWKWRQQEQWRWIEHRHQEFLFDVSADPQMENNLIEQFPERREYFRNYQP